MTDTMISSRKPANLSDEEFARMQEFRRYMTEYMLQRVRKAGRRVSDAELATELGMNPSTYSQYMNMRRIPSVEMILEIVARTGDLTVARIFNLEQKFIDLASVVIESEGLQYIFDNWRYVDEKERQSILDDTRRAAERNKGDSNNANRTNGEKGGNHSH